MWPEKLAHAFDKRPWLPRFLAFTLQRVKSKLHVFPVTGCTFPLPF